MKKWRANIMKYEQPAELANAPVVHLRDQVSNLGSSFRVEFDFKYVGCFVLINTC